MKGMKNAIGIDIGNNFIKIAILGYNKKDVILKDYIIEKTPIGLVTEGVINSPDELSIAVSKILKEKGIDVEYASIGVSYGEETSIIKWVEVPNLTDKEMNKAVVSIVEDELMHSPDVLYYNWGRTEKENKDSSEVISIILVGVFREVMDSHIDSLKKSKIKPYFAEVDIFSTIRSLITPSDYNKKGLNKLIIDIGGNQTVTGFITDGKLSYVRNIPIGTNTWVQNIAYQENIELEEAEEILLKEGAVYNAHSDNYVVNILSNSVVNLTDSIQDTIYFHKETYGEDVDEIILSGGGSRLSGLSEYVESLIGIDCRIGVPYFISLEAYDSKSEDINSLNTAIGLALKEVHDYA